MLVSRLAGILLLFVVTSCSQQSSSNLNDEQTVDYRKIFLQATSRDQVHLSFAISQKEVGGERTLCANKISLGLMRYRDTAQRVRAVLINECRDKNSGYVERRGEQVDLQMSYRNMTFTRYLDNECLELKKWRHGEHVTNCKQEIAVVVDGDWLTDPVNGTHNFHFEMAYAARQ
jgi:hypothetical protein